jgi:hypothetical protein
MKFTHEIWVFGPDSWHANTNNGHMIRSFVSPHGAFRPYAYRVFLETAKRELGCKPRFVRDCTVAGHHYSNADGTIVLELH